MAEPKIKVCGLTRQRDALACKELGVDFCGFIFHPESPRNVAPETAVVLDAGAALRVGVFVNQSAEEVRHIMDFADLDMAQLAGDQDEEFCAEIGPARVIRVFWPERYGDGEELMEELKRFAGFTGYYLLDAGTSGGGSGRSLNFDKLRGIDPPKPWFLAGGLGPHNLAYALERLAPFAVDLNSGVEEEPGVKSRAMLAKAVEAARNI
jgi:phosphoribosylanthranilate isomerase